MKCSLLTLSSYLDGELDAARLAEVEAHLVGCDRCRAGLEYLREETERFGALGRVHVPDAAVPGFLQQLGLIGPDDILPPRPPRPPDPPGPPGGGVTPWRARGSAGQALPWAPTRPAVEPTEAEPPDSNQPSLPFTDSLAARGLRLVRRADPDASESFDIQLRGRSLEVPPTAASSELPAAPGESAEPVMSPADRESTAPETPPEPETSDELASPAAAASTELVTPRAPAAPAVSAPQGPVAPAASGEAWPRQAVDLEGVSIWHLGSAVPAAAAKGWAGAWGVSPPVEGTPAPSPDPARPGTIWDGITYSPPPSEARERLGGAPPRTPLPDSIPLTSSPPPWLAPTPEPSPPSWQTPTPRSAQPAPPPPPPPPPPGSGAPPPPSPPAVPAWRPPSRVDPPGSSAREDDPWSWAPRDDAPPPPARVPPPPASPPGAPDHPPRSAAADPTWPLGGPDAPPEPDGSDQDAAPDPLIDSVIARAARPPQPVPTTLISRLRDQVALRLALRRGAGAAAEDTAGDTAVAGQEAAGRPATRDSIGPLVAAMRSRMDPPNGASPHPRPVVEAAPTSGLPGPDRVEPSPWHEMPFRTATIAEELPRTAVSPGVRDLDRGPRALGRHTRRLGESRHRAGSAGGSVAQMAARFGELPHQVRRLAAHPRRRWLLVAGLAALVLIVSLVVIHPGAPSPVARPLTTPAPVASLQPSLAPATQPATNLAPSASSAPTLSPAATATPVPTPAPLASSQSFGSGGSGWAIADVRYGTQPDGDQWIVIDFSGGTGEPRATAGFSSPTTLVVTLTRANAPSLAPGTGGIVTKSSATEISGGESMVFDLSKAVALKSGSYTPQDSSSPYPLHLILDLG